MARNAPTYEEFLQSIADRNPPVRYWEHLMEDDEMEAKNLYVQHLAELSQTEEEQPTVDMPASPSVVQTCQRGNIPLLIYIVPDSSQMHLVFDMKEGQFPTQHTVTKRDNDSLAIQAPRGVILPRGKDTTNKDTSQPQSRRTNEYTRLTLTPSYAISAPARRSPLNPPESF